MFSQCAKASRLGELAATVADRRRRLRIASLGGEALAYARLFPSKRTRSPRVTTSHPTRTLTRDTALNLAGQLAPLAIAFLTLPATIGGLGADRFGILGLAWAILGSAAMVDLALGRAVTKFASSAALPGTIAGAAAVATLNAARAQVILGIAGGLVLAVMTPWLVNSILRVPARARG